MPYGTHRLATGPDPTASSLSKAPGRRSGWRRAEESNLRACTLPGVQSRSPAIQRDSPKLPPTSREQFRLGGGGGTRTPDDAG